MNTFFKLLIFVLILIAGFVGLAFYWTFYKPLPDYQAEITLAGLQQPVDIQWDEYGVPHIYAQNETDLYYALGYVHAQDRLWQMTLSQIAAQGRFAEFFGDNEELIKLDKYQRTLGFWKAAQQLEQEVLSDQERSILQAYSDGINTFIDDNSNRLPVQFSMAEMDPIRWSPSRSLAIARLMGWELNMGWWSEVTYGYLKSILPPKQFEELKLRFPEEAPTTLDSAASARYSASASLMPMLKQEIEKRRLLETQGTHVGSNAWVVDGSKTESGYPLLAGDPHLGLDMPGKWYEVHLNLNGKNISGATIAGVPAVIIGQNDEMAWSFTSIMSDDTDFFIEQADPEDRGRYVADSLSDSTTVYQPFRKQREIIKVKDGDDISLEIRYTENGPVISDIYPVPALVDEQVITLRWTGYEMTHEFRTLYQINWAENFQQFKDALPHFGVPGLNFIYGDVENNIAMFSVAKLPVRSGDPLSMRRGWVAEDNWQGFIPFDEMPKTINPEKGWIANANNKLTTDEYPHYIATFWEPPSRIERITQKLTEKQILTHQDFKALQSDSYSAYAAKITPDILNIIRRQNEYNFDLPVSYLENWDYKYSRVSTAASIFDAFMLNLSRNTLEDDFGAAAYSNFIHHESIPVRTLSRFMQDSSSFFDDVTTPETEDKKDMVLKSMQDAIYFLSDSLGNEPYEWRWEQLHTLTLTPPLFGMAAEAPDAPSSLKMIVENLMQKGPYPAISHGMSVNNGQYNWQQPFEMVLGPSIRRIVDLSDLSRSQSVLPTGQSGTPLSDYYGDQTELWINGEYRWLEQDSSVFDWQHYQKMMLVPADN
ncbi:MAG: penicillin acylase family protein [Balneolaceae bacterium]|nr:penicillin acylase family protein [Balneolaceae bacterium]